MDRYFAWFMARGEDILVPAHPKMVVVGYLIAITAAIILALTGTILYD